MIVLLGDVGTPNGAYHLGDEAMLEAALEALRQRGVADQTVVSSDPASTEERYSVRAVARVGFALLDSDAQDSRLAAVTATAAGERNLLAPSDPAHAVIAAVAASDGVLITGGGNLSAQWPEHILERVAIARIAAALGRPVVMTGQMVGPHLDERAGRLAAELIAGASLIGVRDVESRAIVQQLVGDRAVSLLPDDAAMLGIDDTPSPEPDGPVIATVAPWVGGLPIDDVVSGIADQLAIMSDTAGKDVLFLPHVGTLGTTDDGDSAMHRQIISRLGHGECGQLEPARIAARRHRSASFTFTTRYHPAVFATSHGQPVIAAAVDDYTASKMRGALAFVGATDGLMPLGAVGTRTARALARDIWRTRQEVRTVALDRADAIARAREAWWDSVVDHLTKEGRATNPLVVEPASRLSLVDPEVGADVERLNRTLLPAGTERGLQSLRHAAVEARAVRARNERDAARKELADALVELKARDDTVRELEDALTAAHRVQSALADPAVRRALSRNVERYVPPSTIEALLETRSFRWSRGARRIVGSIRRLTGRAR